MISGSKKWLWTAILLGSLCAIWTAKVGSAQGGEPAAECEGKWSQRHPPSLDIDGVPLPGVPGYPTLTCTPVNCAPGCAQMQVTTAFGPGKICVCNYVGPQPFCCTIAFVNSGASPTPFGDCGGICPTGTSCDMVITYQTFESGAFITTATARCNGPQ